MTENGRARRDRELNACSRAGLVEQRREALRLGEHGVELLDELVRRKAAVGLAEVHRAARGDDPHPDLPRRLHLRLDQPLAALREHVVMVEHRRAAGQRELGEARARRRVLRLGVDPRPHRVELAQPGEEVGLLRAGAREGLVQVVVGVDQAGGDDGAVEVDRVPGVRLGTAADRRDRGALDEQPAALVLAAGVVHRHDDGVAVERRHALPGCDSRSPASVWRMKLAFSQYSEIVAAST